MDHSSAPSTRVWTKKAMKRLTDDFCLPYNDEMQDWAYEVADPNRLGEFVEALPRYSNDPDSQFTLMDIILQSFENSDLDFDRSALWRTVSNHLKRHFYIHEFQIWHWSSFENDLADTWRISPFVREIWNSKAKT